MTERSRWVGNPKNVDAAEVAAHYLRVEGASIPTGGPQATIAAAADHHRRYGTSAGHLGAALLDKRLKWLKCDVVASSLLLGQGTRRTAYRRLYNGHGGHLSAATMGDYLREPPLADEDDTLQKFRRTGPIEYQRVIAVLQESNGSLIAQLKDGYHRAAALARDGAGMIPAYVGYLPPWAPWIGNPDW